MRHAAQELLSEHFVAVARDGPRIRVSIGAGPPITVDGVKAGRFDSG